MTLKLSTKNENIILWQMHFQGKKKKYRIHYVLFLFCDLIGWKKQGYNETKIIQQLQEDPIALDKFVCTSYLLRYHDRLYLCNNSQLE
jgi:hypothetical protein